MPLFVSTRRLRRQKTFPRAKGPWCLDSGGFTELSMFGEWRVSAMDYAAEIDRYAADIGGLEWAAPQDWMCEPTIRAKTRSSVLDHQERTIASVLELRSRTAANVIPVLQGWSVRDYLHHADLYERAGFDLRAEPTVGVGTVCRRQSTTEGIAIITALADRGFALHGFGIKIGGVKRAGHALKSSDSMAWSYSARRAGRQEGCAHASCANCLPFALRWRTAVVGAEHRPKVQVVMPWGNR